MIELPENEAELVLLGMCGPKGSGKSTLARLLVSRMGFERVSVAEPLRGMARAMGVPERYLYEEKETPIPGTNGLTVRKILQRLGTWVRAEMGEEYLARLMVQRVEQSRGWVVVDDIRSDLEAQCVRAAGGKVVCCGRWPEDPEHWTEEPLSEALIDYRLQDAYAAREAAVLEIGKQWTRSGEVSA